jgi:exonuclease SbcD
VELTYVTESSIDATTRKAIMNAHDGIVNLIPQLQNQTETQHVGLQAEDLEKDMRTLFQLFYKSEKGQEPNKELLDIFKEVIGQNDSL